MKFAERLLFSVCLQLAINNMQCLQYENCCKYIFHVLKRAVDINAVDRNGRTALHYAVEQGHLSVVKFLLANKADIYIRYLHVLLIVFFTVYFCCFPLKKNFLYSDHVHGYTPFMEAAKNGNEFVFNRFLEHVS